MPTDRLGLINALNGLPLVQFNALVFELKPPAGLMPPPMASQGDRSFALVSWAEGYGGCGLPRIQQVLQQILTHQTQASDNPNTTVPDTAETPGTASRTEQSLLKGANVGGSVNIGSINQTVNNQSSGTGGVNIGGNASGTVIVTGSGNNFYLGKENTSPSEGSVQNRHNLPRSGVAKFVGRETELDTLHEKLQQSGRLNIAAIKGMGGIGKSELALQYAYRHWDLGSYPGGLCWLDLRSGDLGGQIVRFARNYLKLDVPDGLDLADQLAYCWRDWPRQPGEVLVIYDNAGEYGELLSFLPLSDPRFRVLITSRNRMGSPVETIEILVLDDGSSLELLGELGGKSRVQSQSVDAQKLCQRLGYLPLAIELVGRYLAKKPDLSLSVMLMRLEEKGLSAKALAETEVGMTGKHGVEAAFELSWQELDERGQELGCLLSLFAEAPIPWKLVEECLSERDSEDLEDLRDAQLCGLSLLERPKQGEYQLHTLIREYFGRKREQFSRVARLKGEYCRVIVSQAQEFPLTPRRMEWEGFALVVPHLAEVADRLLEWVEDKNVWWIFTILGRYYKGQGAYAQAAPWYERCLNECRTRLSNEHPYVATSLNNLALLYDNQGQYAESEQLYQQALELRRNLLGEEHPEVAQSLNNLANLYNNQGRYSEAEPLLVQALALRRKLLGNEHLDVASSLNNLAGLYDNQGRYSEAEPLYKQALELNRKLLGDEHPYVATSLNNLALLYGNQGRYAEAEPLYQQSLELRRKLLGDRHPDVATSLLSVGYVYSRQGRYAEAEPLYQQSLELYRKLLGAEHPNVLVSLNNLAGLYYEQGRYSEAEHLYAQAVSIAIRSLGADHPNTEHFFKNYRQCLQKMIYEGSPLVNTLLANGSEITKQVLGELLQANQ
jgi:tetratricopeptide (TPR) repeat protein